MLDRKLLIDQPEVVAASCATRGCDVAVPELAALERERRALKTTVEQLRRAAKGVAREAMRSGLAPAERARGVALRQQRRALTARLASLRAEVDERAARLPNILDPRVPSGGLEASVILRSVGTPGSARTPLRTYDEVATACDLLDVRRGRNSAGPRFPAFKREMVLLRFALRDLLWQRLKAQGFHLVSPPTMVKERTVHAAGYLPFDQRSTFTIAQGGLALVTEGDQALVNLHLNATLPSLPVAYLGDTTCFQLWRRGEPSALESEQISTLHQFVLCHPDEAEHWHLRCLENEEWLLQQLGLPYRVTLVASEAGIAPRARLTYSTEAWFPARQAYRAVTSNSSLGDFQTRRAGTRFKAGRARGHPYTISAAAFCDRILFAVFENFQERDGAVTIPEALRPYLGELHRIPARKRSPGAA